MKQHLLIPIIVALICAATPSSEAAVLVDLNADFSDAAQGINGLQYGNYVGSNAITGVFSTTNWIPTGFSGWYGGEALSTPFQDATRMHPAVNTLQPAVRRYTIGAGGEPAYSGLVEIAGSFSHLDIGPTSGFITIDGVNVFNLPIPLGGPALAFDIIVSVAPGSTIDFGVNAGTSAISDMTAITATVSTTTVPEPSSLALLLGGTAISTLVHRRRRNG